MTNTSKTILSLVSACLLLALSGPAAAQDPRLRPPPSTTVDASDLDLSQPADAQILYERIRQAARRVCTLEHDNWWDKARVRHRNRCIESAVESAVYRAKQPQLTAVHFSTSDSERIAGLQD